MNRPLLSYVQQPGAAEDFDHPLSVLMPRSYAQ